MTSLARLDNPTPRLPGAHRRTLPGLRGPLAAVLALGLLAACAPAAPSPTPAPPKPTEAPRPAPTVAPARPTDAPQPAARPTEASKPAPRPIETPAAKPVATAGPAWPPAPFDEKAVADFYRGKTVRILVGFAPGGTYDTSARLVARHLSRYLPGSPTVIVENRAGAGSILAANQVFSSEPKDGTVIVAPHENIVLQQALGAQGIQFDAARFQWLGNAMLTASVCTARTDSAVKSIQDLLEGKELVVGTIAPGTTSHDTPAILNALLGTKMKLVSGYAAFPQIKVAMEAREVEAACGGFDGFTLVMPELLEGNPPTIRVLVRMAGSKAIAHPALQDVPLAENLARTEEDRLLIRVADAPAEMSKPLAVAPEVPRERVAALRAAVARAFRDPQLLAEASQAKLEVVPSSSEEVQQVVQRILSAPPAALARLKDILK